jgi:hypothetical protein
MTANARSDLTTSNYASGSGQRLSAILRGYFFRSGGAYSAAICRVALFSYLLNHVHAQLASAIGNAEQYLHSANLAAYTPKGLVWVFFPTSPPPAWVVQALFPIALISSICALVGLLTRPAMIVSVMSFCFLAGMLYSWEPLWSHQFNGGLLAGIGFMFGRAGDVLSVDSLIARYALRRPISIKRRVYWWPVILGQFGTAAVYFGGFYAKWSSPDYSFDLAWVFSDNLRNSVALPWLIWGRQIPLLPELIINHEWIWKTAAFGHLATQALPILAMLSLGKPWVRLTEGAIYIAGVVLLGAVMGIWNLPWIILAAFFVDWEFFAGKFGIRLGGETSDKPSISSAGLIIGWSLAFMLANIAIIVMRFDDTGRNRAYPFSSMNFYSSAAASKPYTEHHFYPFLYGELEFEYRDGTRRKWSCFSGINVLYLPGFQNAEDIGRKLSDQESAIRSIVERVKANNSGEANDCEGSVNLRDYVSIDLFASVLDIPAYPERARFEVGHRALVGRYEVDRGRILVAGAAGLRGSSGRTLAIDVDGRGFDDPKFEVLFANDPWKHHPVGPHLIVPGAWTGNAFEINADYYSGLVAGWYPIVIRVTEGTGRSYDFAGGVFYKY